MVLLSRVHLQTLAPTYPAGLGFSVSVDAGADTIPAAQATSTSPARSLVSTSPKQLPTVSNSHHSSPTVRISRVCVLGG